jgi:hypothetical protein
MDGSRGSIAEAPRPLVHRRSRSELAIAPPAVRSPAGAVPAVAAATAAALATIAPALGRGLTVGAALAESWGWQPGPLGKVVWCELSATPAVAAVEAGG